MKHIPVFSGWNSQRERERKGTHTPFWISTHTVVEDRLTCGGRRRVMTPPRCSLPEGWSEISSVSVCCLHRGAANPSGTDAVNFGLLSLRRTWPPRGCVCVCVRAEVCVRAGVTDVWLSYLVKKQTNTHTKKHLYRIRKSGKKIVDWTHVKIIFQHLI